MPAFDHGGRWVSVSTGQPVATRGGVDLLTRLRMQIEARADELVASEGLPLDDARDMIRAAINQRHAGSGFQC